MTSLTEDTKDGSPTIPPIPPIANTSTVDTAAAANADDTKMTASTAEAQAATTANASSTTNATATDSTSTSNSASNHVVHRTVQTQRKVAKRTPFPAAAAPAVAVVPEEMEEEDRTTTAATASQVVGDTHDTVETETSAVKISQEEGEEEQEQVSDDSERRDATTTVSPVVAADSTPTATDVPTTTNDNTTTPKTITEILEMAVEPRLNDVLFVDDNCLEDSKINKKWPGNRQYRAWIQARVVEFQTASNRSEQTRLAREVAALVRQQSPEGRFLERLSYPGKGNNGEHAYVHVQSNTTKENTKSVWVKLDATAVLMELSKSLWEAPLEDNKLSDKQQQMLQTKRAAEKMSGTTIPMKNGDQNKNGNKKKDQGNANAADKILDNGVRTSRQDQQLLLQHAKAASTYGDYFHTLYITPVYSISQSPSSNTAASMMQEKKHHKQEPHNQRRRQQKKQQQRTLKKSAPASFSIKRRPSLDKSQDLPLDMNVSDDDDDGDDDDSKSEQSHDASEKSADSKLVNNNGKAKRKSSSNDKKPKPKRNSTGTDKPKQPRIYRNQHSKKLDAKRRGSTGSVRDNSKKETAVSPLSEPSEPALKKRKTLRASASASFGTTRGPGSGSGSGSATKATRGKVKPARSSSTSPTKKKKSEKKSYVTKMTATDELGLPRGVTMRPSGKWVRD
jgi:hypothetical protein